MKNWNKKDNYNSDIDYQKALKKKKLLKVINIISYILSGICIILLLVGCINSCTKKKEDNPQVNNVVERAPVNRVYVGQDIYFFTYNDFSNLSLFNDIYEEIDESGGEDYVCEGVLTLTNTSYSYDLLSSEDDGEVKYVYFNNNGEGILEWAFDYLENSIVFRYYNGEDYIVLTESDYVSLSFDTNSQDFNDILDNYISSDIQYDEELFDAVTDTVTNFIGTLSSGIGSVLALFWANNSLTVLGTLTVIVVGVALVYFLFRFIIGLTRLRG